MALLVAAAPATASAATRYVDDDRVECPAAAFTSIQAAVDASAADDTVRVCAGTFNEQVIAHKPVKLLRGTPDHRRPVVRLMDINPWRTAVSLRGGALMSGFTLLGPGEKGIGVSIRNATLRHSTVFGFDDGVRAGVNRTDALVYDNRIVADRTAVRALGPVRVDSNWIRSAAVGVTVEVSRVRVLRNEIDAHGIGIDAYSAADFSSIHHNTVLDGGCFTEDGPDNITWFENTGCTP